MVNHVSDWGLRTCPLHSKTPLSRPRKLRPSRRWHQRAQRTGAVREEVRDRGRHRTPRHRAGERDGRLDAVRRDLLRIIFGLVEESSNS